MRLSGLVHHLFLIQGVEAPLTSLRLFWGQNAHLWGGPVSWDVSKITLGHRVKAAELVQPSVHLSFGVLEQPSVWRASPSSSTPGLFHHCWPPPRVWSLQMCLFASSVWKLSHGPWFLLVFSPVRKPWMKSSQGRLRLCLSSWHSPANPSSPEGAYLEHDLPSVAYLLALAMHFRSLSCTLAPSCYVLLSVSLVFISFTYH